MAKEKFVLVSLKESKTKKLAQVIQNQSCRSILDYLAENNDATETELANKLQIPISTVHYNLKHLLAAGLVSSEEFHYSKKGKEVSHYKLANKYIIIAPRSTYGIKEKLKSILPIGLITLAVAAFLQFMSSFKISTLGGTFKESRYLSEQANKVAADAAQEIVSETQHIAANIAATQAAQFNPALWFLFGSLFAIFLIIIFELVKAKRNK